MKRVSPTLVLTERHGKGSLIATQRNGNTTRPVEIKGNLALTQAQITQLIEWLSANPADVY